MWSAWEEISTVGLVGRVDHAWRACTDETTIGPGSLVQFVAWAWRQKCRWALSVRLLAHFSCGPWTCKNRPKMDNGPWAQKQAK